MNKELARAVGLELADIRNTKNYSIIDVATKIDINRDTISRYENGTTSVKLYILDLLLELYEVPLDIFFKNVYARMQKYEKEV